MMTSAITGTCNFNNFGQHRVVKDEGRGVGRKIDISLEACKTFCNQDPRCHSVAYCNARFHSNECFTKEKVLLGNEATKYSEGCTTYFRDCGIVFFIFKKLDFRER